MDSGRGKGSASMRDEGKRPRAPGQANYGRALRSAQYLGAATRYNSSPPPDRKPDAQRASMLRFRSKINAEQAGQEADAHRRKSAAPDTRRCTRGSHADPCRSADMQ